VVGHLQLVDTAVPGQMEIKNMAVRETDQGRGIGARLVRATLDVAAALAYDFGTDCGIYNVGTVDWARRRGLGTAVTAGQLHEALARGCQIASLQSTPMAERMYAAVGFRDLGRILEYATPDRT
jgi:GNAT superfamily N-acetyltransferase